MKINHRNTFDIDKVIKHYTEKDGVPVSYVCTSEVGGNNLPCDIFYRDTPHPVFGNKYFSLVNTIKGVYIGNADSIEKEEFGMVDNKGVLEYSRYRHDFHSFEGCAVDGGRAYFKLVGDLSLPTKMLQIRNGKFEEK